jgi:leucyl/phenylalanyl-tRNA--protein transferase
MPLSRAPELWRHRTPASAIQLVPATLTRRLWFPDARTAQRTGRHEGLVAVGGDLSVPRLLLAYRSGIFPWTEHPITWWSPDPRAVFEFDRVHIPESLARIVRKGPFKITMDRAFRQVMEGCAEPATGRESTWVTAKFIDAYSALHREGHAHSVECWENDSLVGGIYGVSVGGFFAGESMFHRISNASKVALYHLVQHVRECGFALFDIQMLTPVTRRLGAVEIPREEYLKRLRTAVEMPCVFRADSVRLAQLVEQDGKKG